MVTCHMECFCFFVLFAKFCKSIDKSIAVLFSFQRPIDSAAMDEVVVQQKLSWIGLNESKINDTVKNKQLTKILLELIEILQRFIDPNSTALDRNVGKLLYQAATTYKAQIYSHLPLIVEYIAKKKIDTEQKLQAAFDYLLSNQSEIDLKEFESNCGVGVVISEQQISDVISKEIEKHRKELEEKKYRFNVGIIISESRKTLKFADGKIVKAEVDRQLLNLLGPKNAHDLSAPKNPPKQSKAVDINKNSISKESEILCEDIIELLRRVNFHKVGDNHKTDGYVITANTMRLLNEHKRIVGGKVRTRFPPEPNGILHIGHAKAININFGYAEAHGGECILRYDDTNPEKEEQRFVDSIHEMVSWLGYKPCRITYSSDYFDELYELAVKLIELGLAYVCHQKAEDLKGFNPPPSPWRNRSIEENLHLFDSMKSGKLSEGEATLRMKFTMEEGKQDPVAYRIKMTPHHRTGSKWCIYPTYDFTHCLVDSMENITHSLCTKEFQSRRSAYYWLCNSLNVYCPVQWEYGRLNVYYTVVSKRKIAKLIEEKIVDDWDDPRLFTLTALRRRGFPPEAIKIFCAKMGVTGANTAVDPAMLEAIVRDVLNTTARRAMVVLNPLKIRIVPSGTDSKSNVPIYLEVPDFPADAQSPKHSIPFTNELFIEYDDFKTDHSDTNFRRLTPKQIVGLRYANSAIELKEIVYDQNQPERIDHLECILHRIDSLPTKPKAFIHWVSLPLSVEVRLYERLFNHKNPEDPSEVPNGFVSDCNRKSKTIISNALADISLKYAKPFEQFQFERVGFFSVDSDSVPGGLVFNRTVSLKESSGKN
ncbi:putative glutamine--tRNA ligase [Sarcoptes scabiei]|uniref:Probable glutamine--tRNA ligase n=1 Tax=Sarcoptes scabiei TaxID=52283 RepID=A0A834VBZ5_SARSC|nr:putative glutamine--tRNA ligase [Sarcoptes scabiei]